MYGREEVVEGPEHVDRVANHAHVPRSRGDVLTRLVGFNSRGEHTWSSFRFWSQSSARMSQGTTSVISPNASESTSGARRHRIWWHTVIHVVPHLGSEGNDARAWVSRDGSGFAVGREGRGGLVVVGTRIARGRVAHFG